MIDRNLTSVRIRAASLALIILLTAACSQLSRPWGDVEIATGAPIRIGLLTDADGAAAPDLPEASQSVDGHPLQLVPVPVHCGGPAAASAPDPAALDGLAGVIGAGCSSACIYSEGLLYEDKTTLIAAGCTATAVVQSGYPIAFRVAWNDADQALLAADYARSTLHAGHAAVVSDKSAYARALAFAYTAEFKDRGGKSVAEIDIPATGEVNITQAAAQIRSSGAQSVLLSVSRADAAGLFSRLQEALPNLTVIASDSVFAPSAGASTPAGLVAAGLTRDSAGWTSEVDAGPLSAGLFAPQEADAVSLYARAISKVARPREGGALTIPRQGLRDALARLTLAGETGSIAFDPHGERLHDVGAALYRLGDGSPVRLAVYER